ncbi:ABC transporter permease subunit [Caulobacter sp. 17J80-11]|nr:ABC transporter permease subunit [Caulobacter sp. 17J80-11]
MGDGRRRLQRLTGGWGGLALQVGLVAVLVLTAWWMGHNAEVNMQTRGVASGFDFLDRPAGFDITQALVPYEPTDTHRRVFLVGALNTLLVAALGIAAATGLGLLAGVLRVSRNYLARTAATAYVELARNTPLPVQILVWYNLMLVAPPPKDALGIDGLIFLTNRGLYLPKPVFNAEGGTALAAGGAAVVVGALLASWLKRRRTFTGHAPSPRWGWALAVAGVVAALVVTGNPTGFDLPHLEGWGFTGGVSLAPALTALWAALSFYTGGFIAEVVRGGLNAVSPGQGEAARSLGLDEGQALSLVVLPQAMRVIVPPLASQYLNLTKNSSLAVIIGYPDLVAVFAGTSLNQTGQAIETLALVMAFYLVISLSISAFMNWWNSRSAVWAVSR